VIAHLRLTMHRTKEAIALAMSPSRHINHRVSSLLPGVTVATGMDGNQPRTHEQRREIRLFPINFLASFFFAWRDVSTHHSASWITIAVMSNATEVIISRVNGELHAYDN
jgi:hypothetical protein